MSQKRAAVAATTTIFIYLLSSHKHYYCRVHGRGHCRPCCINGASIHIERRLDFHNNDTVSTYVRLGTVFSNKRISLAPSHVLVWFWLIDEILSANLVYQSDHEIGSTFQVVKQW